MISTLMDDLEGFKSSMEEVTADVVERSRELELELEPEDGTELLQSHGNTLTDEELFLMQKQRKWFLEMESTPGEDALTTVEMRTKDVEYYVLRVEKTVAGFERIGSNFEKEFYCGENPIKQDCMVQKNHS